jgi:hypothetical protein
MGDLGEAVAAGGMVVAAGAGKDGVSDLSVEKRLRAHPSIKNPAL